MSTPARWFRISFEVDGRTVQQVNDSPLAIIGRSPVCEIVLPRTIEGVSREHAVFRLADDGWHLQDKGSRNGTFVNQSRVHDQLLHDGDTIHLGPCELTFHDSQALDNQFAPARPRSESPPVSMDDNLQLTVSKSLSLADMSRSLGPTFRSLHSDNLSGDEPFDDPPLLATRIPGPALFHRVGEALLSSNNLTDMLERILQLVFECVPARSGMIGMRDASGSITPTVSECRTFEPLRVSRSIVNRAVSTNEAILVEDATASPDFAHVPSINEIGIHSVICVPLYHDEQISGVIYVDSTRKEHAFSRDHLELLSALSLFSAIAVQEANLREDIERERAQRERLSRYFSPAVVDQIVDQRQNSDDEMLAEERDVSVLFADLRGFTAMSERMQAHEVVRMINGIWERMNSVVFRYHGALDKFMGDGMMAFFGAPLAINNHHVAAVRAALQMQIELEHFNAESGTGDIGMRIGVNSGIVVMGDIGSETRKDFTVIGDTVNVASRLESTVAQPGQVVVGPVTYEHIKDAFRCTPLEPVPLKGKSQTVQPYLVEGLLGSTDETTEQ